MNEWWMSLSVLQQILFIIGVATTLFMIIQIIMIVVGGMGGEEDAFDGDGDGVDDIDTFNDEGFGSLGGLKLFSLRTVIVFLAIGSWMSFALCPVFVGKQWIAVIIGAAIGVGAAIAFAFALRAFMRLQSSGNIDAENCKGLIGDVYLTIPANRSACGKVQVIVQERLTEFDAVTDSDAAIITGSQVKIIDNINQGILLVAPLKKED